MRNLILIILLPLIVLITSFTAFAKESCVECHKTLGKKHESIVAGVKNDIHLARGISCAGCHGGDPNVGFDDPSKAMDPAKGYIGAPRREKIPEFCARCHNDVEYMKRYNPKLRTDQIQEYRSSFHGKLLAKGDKKVPDCTGCHSVHGILSTEDPRSPVYSSNIPKTCARCHSDREYMSQYGIPTDQYDKYKRSIHGKMRIQREDKSAPACNDCHGNHGATPPGLTSVASVCGECHPNNRDFFNQSPHKIAFDRGKLPECVVCHSYHLVKPVSDKMIGGEHGSVCISCHKPRSNGYKAAIEIRQSLDNLKKGIEEVKELVLRTERAGVDVSLTKFDLSGAGDALMQARNLIHTSMPTKIKEITDQGMARLALVKIASEKSLKDLRTRRIGLAVSAGIILFLAGILLLKIKQIDKKTKMGK